MGFAPDVVVDPIEREPLKYGLLSAVELRFDGGDVALDRNAAGETPAETRWQNGVTFETLGCEPASGFGEPDCTNPGGFIGAQQNVVFNRGLAVGFGQPMNVYETFICTPAGHDGTAEGARGYWRDRVLEKLKAREVQRVEDAIWTGSLYNAAKNTGNPGFAPGATILNPNNAVSVRYAIALLEKYISQTYGSRGILHMSRVVANIGLADFSLDTFPGEGVDGSDALRTQLGTPVVAGPGYNGLDPNGVDPGLGKSYIYATPKMIAWKSRPQVIIPDAPATYQKNDLEAMALDTWVVAYDPCPVYGVFVDLNIFA